MINFPKTISQQSFLLDYWQQMPLFFKSAITGTEQLISQEQLFDLSIRDEVESRLLMENGPDEAWQVFHGPQKIEQLQSLSNASHWTLLVQSVNLWHQNCAKLLQQFDFIPQWQLDDIMISYAAVSGTVGPHLDHYDVFLLQLCGSRRWLIGEPDAKVEYQEPDTANQHIKPYISIIDQVLKPGDMLYVPANTAHHGISIEPGMTLSVGFRSPALSEMMMIVAEQIMLHKTESYLTKIPCHRNNSASEISSAAMSKAVNWFSDLEQYDELKCKSFGLLQTQPKQELLLAAIDRPAADFVHEVISVERDPAARIAWYQANETTIWLFINGEFFQRPVTDKTWIEYLNNVENLTSTSISGHITDDNFILLLQIYFDSGFFGIK